MNNIKNVISIFASLCAFNVMANEPAPEVFDEPTGVRVEYEADGTSWVRIRSGGEAELKFGDRKDVVMATRKATLAAKADIAKYLNERVSSSETISSIDKVLSEKNGSNPDSAIRKSIETTTLEMHNSANEILKGVVTLEQKIDTKNGLVRVVVGLSHKSMASADSIKSSLKRDTSQPSTSLNNNYENKNSESSEVKESQVKDEVRRSKSYNDF